MTTTPDPSALSAVAYDAGLALQKLISSFADVMTPELAHKVLTAMNAGWRVACLYTAHGVAAAPTINIVLVDIDGAVAATLAEVQFADTPMLQ